MSGMFPSNSSFGIYYVLNRNWLTAGATLPIKHLFCFIASATVFFAEGTWTTLHQRAYTAHQLELQWVKEHQL